jgi:hypothetical protein
MADTTYITRDPSPQSEADEKFRLAVGDPPHIYSNVAPTASKFRD